MTYTRPVTEADLRAPEYRQGDVDQYEFRADGKIVRKDRFVQGMRDIAAIVLGHRDYEIDDVIAAVRQLPGVRFCDVIDNAKYVYENDPKALEVIDYIKAVFNNPTKKES